MTRRPSGRVASSPGCEPLRRLFQQVCDTPSWSRWDHVERGFLGTMWDFDQNFITGLANQGDNQNGKGDFFTDLICVILEHCSGKILDYRPGVPGRIFKGHALDAAYPPAGTVEILIETKAAGAPKNPRSPQQKNPLGRPGSADLDKRVKEAGLKTIDLKAEWARLAGKGEGPTGDFITWLKRSKPACYLLLSVRVLDETDLKRAVVIAEAAHELMDGCGLFCYQPLYDHYAAVKVPTQLEMDRVLSRICDHLRSLP
jgi:hypothetical protein